MTLLPTAEKLVLTLEMDDNPTKIEDPLLAVQLRGGNITTNLRLGLDNSFLNFSIHRCTKFLQIVVVWIMVNASMPVSPKTLITRSRYSLTSDSLCLGVIST